MFFKYKKNIYHLLLNKKLLVLSYNQILASPENFVFDINLRYALSIDKKSFLQNKIIKLIQIEISSNLNDKQSHNFNIVKQDRTLFNKLYLKHLIIQQLINNILNLICNKAKKVLPENFIILQKEVDALSKIKKAMQNVNIAIQFKDIQISNKSHFFIHFMKIIKQFIKDKKFIWFFEEFILNNTFHNLDTKSSKFHKVICDIYLIYLDYGVLQFCKKKISVFFSYNVKTNNKLKHIELLVLKALTLIKNKTVLTNWFVKKNKLQKTSQKFYYIRYFDNIFFGIYNKSVYTSLLDLNNYIIFYCKSVLNLNLKSQVWLNLSLNEINFSAINNKKISYCNLSKKKAIVKNFVPLKQIKKELTKLYIIDTQCRPKPLLHLVNLFTKPIFSWYNFFLFGLLFYYKNCLNYKKLLHNLYYFFKWSLLYTLKKKHKKSIENIILKYSTIFFSKKHLVISKQKPVELVSLKEHIKAFVNFCYVYKYFL